MTATIRSVTPYTQRGTGGGKGVFRVGGVWLYVDGELFGLSTMIADAAARTMRGPVPIPGVTAGADWAQRVMAERMRRSLDDAVRTMIGRRR
ncbi:hypothetical protein A9R05_05440 [Burkholderia sp. KK1]|nr:hypothetical protein A9R05_05440 [Burkholderia sp. KK1]